MPNQKLTNNPSFSLQLLILPHFSPFFSSFSLIPYPVRLSVDFEKITKQTPTFLLPFHQQIQKIPNLALEKNQNKTMHNNSMLFNTSFAPNPFDFLMDGRVFSGEKYRFGFNGQEKVNEISGDGNHNTALFWEYDTRLGRRWNLDPKPQINISDYAVMGCNPVMNMDWLGDIWGTPGDKEDNTDKQQAVLLKNEFSTKRDEYKSTYENLNFKILNFSDDKSNPEFKNLNNQREESYAGMMVMEDAIKGIDEIGKDKNYYKFREIDGVKGEGFMSATKLKGGKHQITFNYSKGENALKAHEYRHGVDITRGISSPKYSGVFSNYTTSFKINKNSGSEINAYMLQCFFDSSSMPVTILNYKEILNWVELKVKINNALGENLYE